MQVGKQEAAPETGRLGVAPDSGERARVLIADPDPLARRVVRDVLQDGAGLVVPAEASSGLEAVELAVYYSPDVALLEIDLAGMDGIAATRQIVEKAPEVKVLIFSYEESEDVQLVALAAGACGFVLKTTEPADVVGAVEAVIRGEAVVPARTMMRLIERLRVLPDGGSGMRPVRSPLTQREWEIVDLMSQGLDTHTMAETLVLAEETIYSHVKNVLRKLNVHSRSEAVRAAQALRDPIAGIAGEGSKSAR